MEGSYHYSDLMSIYQSTAEKFGISKYRMTTKSPMRLAGNDGGGNWVSINEASNMVSSDNSIAAEDLGFLFGNHMLHGNVKNAIPNRSGSAPPSMEGSLAAIRNFVDPQNAHTQDRFTTVNTSIENLDSEKKLCSDPAYLAYYLSNVNLNPRLPQPLNSRENRHLAHHIGHIGGNRRLGSLDDNTNGSLCMSRTSLSPHKEEPEDDKSPTHTSDEWPESLGILSRGFEASPAGRHKSLVDLIQEDFPRTPSPVFNKSHSPCLSTAEGTGSQEAHVHYLNEASLSAINLQEKNVTTVGHGGLPGVHALKSFRSSDSAVAETDMPRSPDLGSLGESSSIHEEIQGSDGANLDSDGSALKMEGLTISNLPGPVVNQLEQRHLTQNSIPQQYMQSHVAYQAGPRANMSDFSSQRSYNGMMDQLSLGPSKLFSMEGQPVLQTSGFSPPIFATATTYMASGGPFYSNLQPSSVYSPQYSMGGYPLSPTLMQPYLTGFGPHGPMPMGYDSSTGTGFNTHPVSITTGGALAPGVDIPQLYKYYGQPGLPFQHSLADPLYMHYFQHLSEDAQNLAGPFVPAVSRGGIIGSQDAYASPRGPSRPVFMDHAFQFSRTSPSSIMTPRKMGIPNPTPYRIPPSMGVLMQYPTSPLASPGLPGSPLTGMNMHGRKVESARSPVSTGRNSGACTGWPGQRMTDKIDDHKAFSFLEELKSSKTHRFELSDIAGRVVELSADQHGSRFIQQKLENCSIEDKAAVFHEVLPHASTLMTDVFGNYVIQKFFEHGSLEQRKELSKQLIGRILALSLQMYGCRVIQKALEVIELDQKTELVHELDGHVMRCVRDQNGNHVIQKCIECVPTDKIEFIISAFRGQVGTLSTHPYGCRVIQRILEHCTDEQQIQCLIDEILQSVCSLAQDQYGNYVTQHLLERGKSHERSQIINKLAGQIVQLSQHKFASNVIEKCLKFGDVAERDLLIGEIVGQTEGNDNLLIMMKDQFANYVVQKILETCTDERRELLLDRIRIHLPALKKYTYGKHIVARVEQLSDEETKLSEQ